MSTAPDHVSVDEAAFAEARRKLRSGAVEEDLQETGTGGLLPNREAVEARIERFVESLESAGSLRASVLHDEMIWTLRRLYGEPSVVPSGAVPQAPLLEMVVVADGSRPVFFFEGGHLTGGAGNGPFFDAVGTHDATIETAARSIGRIEVDYRFPPPWSDKHYAGTGVLIAPGLVLTNRHVMQDMVNESTDAAGPFSLNGNWWINFEAEVGRPSRKRFKITGVEWAAPEVIGTRIDFARLDLALLRAGDPENATDEPPPPLPVCLEPAAARELVFVVGYPGRPKLSATVRPGPDTELETVLAQMFDNRFAGKRCASGEIDAIAGAWPEDVNGWTVKHDASTLNGNSGSPLLSVAREAPATVLALHFGGASRIANYAHSLDRLSDRLAAAGATIV